MYRKVCTLFSIVFFILSSTIHDLSGNSPYPLSEASFVNILATCSGNADAVTSQSNVDNPNNALGAADGSFAELYETNDQLVLDLSDVIQSGQDYDIRWKRGSSTSSNPTIVVEESLDGNTWTDATGSPFSFSNTSFF